MDISSRVPSREQILPVYGVIVLMVHGWTLWWFYYNLPAWMTFMNFGEVFGQFAYSMSTDFFESLVVLAGITLLAIVLPRTWFLDAFVARGAALTVLGFGLLMYIASQFTTKDYYPAEFVRWAPALAAGMLLAAWLIGRHALARRVIELFADRAIIFLYLSIPISVISLFTLLLRNTL